MSNCSRLDDETMNRINGMAEVFSSAIIIGMFEESLCAHASKILAGKILACIATRVMMQTMGEKEIDKMGDINLMHLPEARHVLEQIVIHARTETEGELGARN